MSLNFNMLLFAANFDPSDVRPLRHQDRRRGCFTRFALWRDDRGEFERYESAQQTSQRADRRGRLRASLAVPPDGSTLFAGQHPRGRWIDGDGGRCDRNGTAFEDTLQSREIGLNRN